MAKPQRQTCCNELTTILGVLTQFLSMVQLGGFLCSAMHSVNYEFLLWHSLDVLWHPFYSSEWTNINSDEGRRLITECKTCDYVYVISFFVVVAAGPEVVVEWGTGKYGVPVSTVSLCGPIAHRFDFVPLTHYWNCCTYLKKMQLLDGFFSSYSLVVLRPIRLWCIRFSLVTVSFVTSL